MTKSKKIILSVVVGTVLSVLAFYFTLPAINIHETGFWIFLAFVIAFYSFPFLFVTNPAGSDSSKKGTQGAHKNLKVAKLPLILIIAPIAIMIIGGFLSSELFNAKRYADVINVKEAVFEDDMKETDEVTNIALMDSDSAKIIGNRTLGSLSDVVSQYEISNSYTQINYKGTPKKVANLEYADFFKWVSNRGSGVPGYVMVDPVNNSAEYIKLEKPLKYVSSGYFNDNLMRKLRFSYPTKIFDYVSYEIDENGNPYYIVSCIDANVMLFGAMDVNEVIIFDPCTGDSQLYDIENVPAWVDIVYSGDLATEKYNWKGMLSGGFFNSIIGQKNCRQTTDDYGFIVIEDDVWYFTGVTSITSDESNIGFITTNARTGEYKYYPVVGAEEYSAMKSAEGQVQEKRYVASFPSLINVSGQATYIMVLKDSGGLVRLYALVNVENYSIVATGESQAKAMAEYKRLLKSNGITEDEPEPDKEYSEAEFTVLSVRDMVVGGNSFVYLEGDDGIVYKGSISENESLIFIKAGDKLKVEYTDTEIDNIRSIESFVFSDKTE